MDEVGGASDKKAMRYFSCVSEGISSLEIVGILFLVSVNKLRSSWGTVLLKITFLSTKWITSVPEYGIIFKIAERYRKKKLILIMAVAMAGGVGKFVKTLIKKKI